MVERFTPVDEDTIRYEVTGMEAVHGRANALGSSDVVGLYLNPPHHALVLCVDEKSQIQALDRTQPGLPLKRAAAAR